jgi:hypothetical protein
MTGLNCFDAKMIFLFFVVLGYCQLGRKGQAQAGTVQSPVDDSGRVLSGRENNKKQKDSVRRERGALIISCS